MNRILIGRTAALLLTIALTAPALAGSGKVTHGDGYRLEESKPARQSVKILSPRGAKVRVFVTRKEIYEGTIPFVVPLKGVHQDVSVEVTLADGEKWFSKYFGVKGRTEYRLYVEGPDGYDEAEVEEEPAKAATAPKPAPAATPVAAPAPAPTPAGPSGMPAGDFARLIGALDAEFSPMAKMSVLQSAVPHATGFTVDQVGQIMGQFHSPMNKLEALQLLADKIVDKANGYQLLGQFHSPMNKEEAQQLLR